MFASLSMCTSLKMLRPRGRVSVSFYGFGESFALNAVMFVPKISLAADANNVTSQYFLCSVFIEASKSTLSQYHVRKTEDFCYLATPFFV